MVTVDEVRSSDSFDPIVAAKAVDAVGARRAAEDIVSLRSP
jgi:hypothetical protein